MVCCMNYKRDLPLWFSSHLLLHSVTFCWNALNYVSFVSHVLKYVLFALFCIFFHTLFFSPTFWKTSSFIILSPKRTVTFSNSATFQKMSVCFVFFPSLSTFDSRTRQHSKHASTFSFRPTVIFYWKEEFLLVLLRQSSLWFHPYFSLLTTVQDATVHSHFSLLTTVVRCSYNSLEHLAQEWPLCDLVLRSRKIYMDWM